jgi:membrane-associated phospholipid phosphatase
VVIVVLISLGLLVGWARIWTGAHWASDVIGGYAFGVAIVTAALLVQRRMEASFPDRAS